MSSSHPRRKVSAEPPLPRSFYSVREVAASMGLGYETVLGFCRSGAIRSIKPGQQYLIPAAALKELEASAG